MKTNPISETMISDNRRVLLLLLAFSFILMLAAMSTTKFAYASGIVPSSQRIITGGGARAGV